MYSSVSGFEFRVRFNLELETLNSKLTSGCTAHILAGENPCATHNPASHQAKECGADQDGRQKLPQKDRMFRARANLPYARWPSPSVHEHLLRLAKPSAASGGTLSLRTGDN